MFNWLVPLACILIMCLFLGVQANVSHPWLVPLVHLSSLDYLLRGQATSLACSLRLYSFLIIYRVGVHAQFCNRG